jgi:DNA-binding transcriptional LysR family regulator
MTLLQLEVLRTIVQEGTFTKAGRVLHMTQSAVSHIISSLENELGVTLLQRGRKGIELTKAGEEVLSHAREITYHVHQIHEKVSSLKGLQAGTIRIGTFPSISSYFLPNLLRSFQTQYPNIEAVVFDGTNQEVRNWIYTGAVHIGFVSLPDDEFETVPITYDEMVVLVPASHLLSSHSSISLELLKSDSFIMTKGGCEAFILNLFRPDPPQIQYEVKETSTIISMVQQGLGISVLPKMALPAGLSNISVIQIEPRKYRHLGLGVNDLSSAPADVKTFIDFTKSWAVKNLNYVMPAP